MVELHRPQALNALNSQMTDDLTDAFQQAAEDANVKVVLMTGAGKAFWAGADLKEMGQTRRQPKHSFADMLDAVIDCPKPLILAVNGVGVGIGATICGLADLVLMAEDARLRCPFSSLGLTAEAGSTYTFPQLLGRQQASWFLLSGEWMNAEQCLQAGLALQVLPAEELLPQAMSRAQTLAALPAASLMTTKKLIVEPLRSQLRASIAAENRGLAELAGGPANREALAAFRDKRETNFNGL